jgi:hypothetical protein
MSEFCKLSVEREGIESAVESARLKSTRCVVEEYMTKKCYIRI